MRYEKQKVIIVMIVAAAFLVPAIIWIGMGHAGNDGAVKMPAVSTIGPEMTPYVLTALEREKRLWPVTTLPVPMDFANVKTENGQTTSGDLNVGMTQAELEKLEQWKNRPHPKQQWAPEKTEAYSTIENIPRARGIEGLTTQERAKLEAYLESQIK